MENLVTKMLVLIARIMVIGFFTFVYVTPLYMLFYLIIFQNLELSNEYKLAYDKWLADQRKAQHEFEEKRQGKIQDAVNLKIEVAERFQDVVDEFLNQLK